jgi:hypothetical protein
LDAGQAHGSKLPLATAGGAQLRVLVVSVERQRERLAQETETARGAPLLLPVTASSVVTGILRSCAARIQPTTMQLAHAITRHRARPPHPSALDNSARSRRDVGDRVHDRVCRVYRLALARRFDRWAIR